MSPAETQPAAQSALPPVELTAPAPLAGNERIEILDIIRGIALFGILAANIRGFAAPALAYYDTLSRTATWYDTFAQALLEIFIQGKFITIFAILFGIGFSVQIRRAELRGGGLGSLHFRRMAVLGLIGLAHGLLIWWGDILFVYAITGLLLVLFRNLSTRMLTGWMIVLYLVPFGFSLLIVLLMSLLAGTGQPLPDTAPPPEAIAAIVESYRAGWSEIQSARMSEYLGLNLALAPLMLPNVLGLFIGGLVVWRTKAFAPAAESLGTYRRWMWIFLIGGIVLSAAAVVVRLATGVGPTDLRPIMLVPLTLQFIGTPVLSLGYAVAIILLFQRPAIRAGMHRFAAVGRMALTNYLAQSLIGTLLFYGYGLGWYGQAGPAILIVPTVLIYAAQIWFSSWWLDCFRFGPVEWLWRTLAYGGVQPLRREARPAA